MKAPGSEAVSRADQRWQDQLRRLTRVSRALTGVTTLEEVLRLTVEQAVGLLEADKAVLMLADDEGLLHVRAAHGLDEQLVERFREPLNETLIFRLQSIFSDYTSPDNFLGAPLVVQGQVTGLVAVWRTGAEPPGEADEWLLSALADQAAVAVENARLNTEIQRREESDRDMLNTGELRERALIMLSHDLRSPLNAIQSYADLIEMEVYGPITNRQRHALGRIRLSTRHLVSVLENVLEMARLNAGALELRSGPVRVAEVIDEAVQMVSAAIADKQQELHVDCDGELLVTAEPDRLRQVLLNLLGNAAKYTQRGGSIEVTATVADGADRRQAVIGVADNGPGIPDDQLPNIFTPYYRVADTSAIPGAGLGLAISRELVRHMGGELDVISEPGRGATFRVWLNLAA
jgi:signal transduction histidine kinase